MHDRVGGRRRHRAQRRGAVRQVQLRVRRRDQLGAALGEHVREVRADEAGRAGQENPHRDATSTSATATGRPSRSERQAASPMTSGARASAAETGGGVPPSTAAANASHSCR